MIRDWIAALLPPESRPWLLAMLITLAAMAEVVWWHDRQTTTPEKPKPEQRQIDGSLMLERKPDPTAKPQQIIPRRAKVERIAAVTIQPKTPAPEAGKPCPPITVDLSLIRQTDGNRRILASSPNGQIVGGMDIPVEPISMPYPVKRWSAGISWSPIKNTSGIWIERDVNLPYLDHSARFGIDVNQASSGIDMRLRVGFTF